MSLRADVTTQYLNVLAAVAGTEVAREQVQRNDEFLRLARARHQVGQATMLDVRQAEATRATSESALLQAYQAENEAKLELFRRMGIAPPVPVEDRADQLVPGGPPVYTRESWCAWPKSRTPRSRRSKRGKPPPGPTFEPYDRISSPASPRRLAGPASPNSSLTTTSSSPNN